MEKGDREAERSVRNGGIARKKREDEKEGIEVEKVE